jgi:threonine synthase
MRYVSTRGLAPEADFATACLAGLAPDGGLYVPVAWPQLAPPKASEPYAVLAARVLSAFAGDAIPATELQRICQSAYGRFSHSGVTPLVQWKENHFILELHHGPTLAFKDVAMQAIAGLYDYFLGQRGERLSVVCATSGDTGGAAAHAFAGSRRVDLTILHPFERVAHVQRLFMTTTGAANIRNLAIDSDFDACQAIVKALFADRDFAQSVRLSGVNSINWARIAAQSVYYAFAAAQLGRPLRFVVPSGNMGDALAGFAAWKCGLLPHGFSALCAVNANDALVTLFDKGRMQRAAAAATPSPAMDISVPSNFERALFESVNRDGEAVRRTYAAYAQSGDAALPGWRAGLFRDTCGLEALSVSNAGTLAEMQRFHRETGQLICPHTAVGTAAARRLPASEAATVVLATASPAKFPETVLQATGQDAPLPAGARSLLDRPEVFRRTPPDMLRVRISIAEASGA